MYEENNKYGGIYVQINNDYDNVFSEPTNMLLERVPNNINTALRDVRQTYDFNANQ